MQRVFLSILLAAAFFSAGCGTAQNATSENNTTVENRQRPGARGGNQAARLDAEIAELGLSDDQAKSYREINERYQEKRRALRQNAGGDRQKMMAEGGKLRAAQEREVFEVLDDAQREKYNAMIEQRKSEMRDRQRVRRPGGRGE